MAGKTRLKSWKEIASYLECDVRTALRWEKVRGLPVRSIPGGKRRRVFAFEDEIEAWLTSSDFDPHGNDFSSVTKSQRVSTHS